MSASNACSALVNGVCLNGFPVTPACCPAQVPWKCHACKRDSDRQPTPFCMSEDWCARVLETFGGKPLAAMVDNARARSVEGRKP
jgi:hypothetical protein